MTKDNSLKKIAKELKENKSKIRGEAILNKMAYIGAQRGEDGTRVVDRKLRALGYSLDLKKIRSLDWYPDAYSVLILLVAKELFDWSDDDIYAMGKNSPRISFIVKLLMKYFVSIERTFKSAPQSWQKHHNEGAISDVIYKEEEKQLSFRLKDYKIHPIMCVYLSGYFLSYAEIVLKNQKVKIQEIKCMFKGDSYHEFKITWK